MEVLVVGGGGREHAICYALKKNKDITKIYCAPGNGGISDIAECLPDIKATDLDGILEFVKAHPGISMTVVAPDDPLALGLVDLLNENGFRAFGPTKDAAQIEASKVFSKNLMKKYGIPTADYQVFDDARSAKEYLKTAEYPIVVKADGLALGKGVIICKDKKEATKAVNEIMLDHKFGKSGNQIVIEEFLTGYEVSVLAFCDGKTILPMVTSQDHKRALDNDQGLNTGGMGAFSPSQRFGETEMKKAYNDIFLPTLGALCSEGITFKGVLYFGLMVSDKGVKVLEYNARFGDPETQAVLVRLENDLYDIFNKVIDQKLSQVKLKWKDRTSICVIIASGGYPEAYEKGYEIEFGDIDDDCVVFHSGTVKKDGKYYTNGGRVLGVTCMGKNLAEAREKAYANVKKISFKDMHYRTDIGVK
ncbi:MAG TPA: phosphoribosylamine--glycine ligase [Firmicutes bacterium]|nr:phosphoribosylamine--glycine ligase [Bacillota bacterium]